MNKIITNLKKNKLLLCYSFFEGFLLMYGSLLNMDKSLSNFKLYMFLIVLAFTTIFYILNNIYFKTLSFTYKQEEKHKFSKRKLLILWLIIFILWIPVLLAYYPSIWAYDVYDQVPHLIGQNVTNKHPIIHTLFIELFLIIGKKINEYTFGILLLTIVQMIIMSFIFSYSIEKINCKINNKKIRFLITSLLIIYFGIIPFNSIMSISITKDVLFSGLTLLLLIFIYDFIDEEKISKLKYIMFMIIAVLFILIKSNSLFIFIFLTLMFIILYKGNKKKKIIIVSFSSIIISIILNSILVASTNSKKYSKFETYNIQIQNLIYVAIKHPSINENKEELFDIIPRKCFDKNLSNDFDINRVDYAKDKLVNCDLNNFNYNKFNNTWIKYGLKYPIDYIDSWSNVTIGSWYLLDETHANTYPGDNQGYLLTDYKYIEGISEEVPDSKFPWLFDKLERVATINVQYKNIGIWRFIFAPATYVLSYLLLLVYVLSKKLRNELIPLMILLGVSITILNAPVIVVRYIYPFMVCVPIIFIRLFTSKKEKLN